MLWLNEQKCAEQERVIIQGQNEQKKTARKQETEENEGRSTYNNNTEWPRSCLILRATC